MPRFHLVHLLQDTVNTGTKASGHASSAERKSDYLTSFCRGGDAAANAWDFVINFLMKLSIQKVYNGDSSLQSHSMIKHERSAASSSLANVEHISSAGKRKPRIV